jgi:hypothetical protein
MRKLRLADDNDNVVYLRGVLDESDPIETNGNPKWINNATVTWTLRDPNGSVAASGTAVAIGAGGAYRCDLPDTISYSDVYLMRVVCTLPTTNLVATFDALVEVFTRQGSTVLA